jgi:hypothetical protein
MLGKVNLGIIADQMHFIAAAFEADDTDNDNQGRIVRAVALLAKKEEARSSGADVASNSPSTIDGRGCRGVASHHIKPLFRLMADTAFVEDARQLREMIEGVPGQSGVRKHAHECIALTSEMLAIRAASHLSAHWVPKMGAARSAGAPLPAAPGACLR